MTIRIIWLLASFVGTCSMLLAAHEVYRDKNRPVMKYLFAALLGSAQLCAGLFFLSVRSLFVYDVKEPLTAGIIVVTVCMLVFVIPASAFALRLIGWLGD